MPEKISGDASMLVEIEDAELMKTKVLLAVVLTHLNEDRRVRFFTSRGRGAPTVQCLRVALSRVRQELERKGKKRKHFKLHAEVIPWTELDGRRRDAVFMERSRNQNHEVLELLEDLASNGTGAAQFA